MPKASSTSPLYTVLLMIWIITLVYHRTLDDISYIWDNSLHTLQEMWTRWKAEMRVISGDIQALNSNIKGEYK